MSNHLLIGCAQKNLEKYWTNPSMLVVTDHKAAKNQEGARGKKNRVACGMRSSVLLNRRCCAQAQATVSFQDSFRAESWGSRTSAILDQYRYSSIHGTGTNNSRWLQKRFLEPKLNWAKYCGSDIKKPLHPKFRTSSRKIHRQTSRRKTC